MTEGHFAELKQEWNVPLARRLRGQMSLPEVMLWQSLCLGDLRFRRQHPIGRYVLDFYCATAGVCIEVDGIAHGMGARAFRDAVRDSWLAEQGITVLRIPPADMLRDADRVAEGIFALCTGC